jgi:hypothetical protein
MPRAKRVPRDTPRDSPYERSHEDNKLIHTSPYTQIDSENGEIRVLKLAPGKFDDTIVMHLLTRSLSDISQAPYEALSYVWGTEITSQKAYLNGTPITITSNLDCALRHLRLNLVPRNLWIDAISMNQEDIQERNHQVQLMSSIYSTAQSVIVWLGSVDQTNLHSRAVLGAMRFHFVEKEPSIITLFDYICEALSLLSHEDSWAQSHIEEKALEVLHRIVDRPWFHRIWVVQELALSQSATIQIGPYSFPWQPFERFFKWLTQYKLNTQLHSDVVEAVSRVEKAKSRLPFADQLIRTAHLSATDPRDKVFGILGISTFTDTVIKADYAKQPCEVFSEAIATLVQQRCLDLYLHLPLQPPRGQVCSYGLPSWVPDLQITTRTFLPAQLPQERIWEQSKTIYHHPVATLDRHTTVCLAQHMQCIPERMSLAQATISNDGTRLFASGVPLGVIIKTSEDIFSDLYDTPRSSLIHKVCSLYHSIGKPYDIGQEDFFFGLGVGTGRADWPQAVLALCNPNIHDLVLTGSVRREVHDTCTNIVSSVSNKIIFVTDTGHIGRLYHPDLINGVRPGDVVAGLFGIKFPFVLRPDEHDTYRMINVAAIHPHESGWYSNSYGRHRRNFDWEEYKDNESYKESNMKEYTII